MKRKIIFLSLILLLLPVMIVPAMAVGPKNSEVNNPNVDFGTPPGTTQLYRHIDGMGPVYMEWYEQEIELVPGPIPPIYKDMWHHVVARGMSGDVWMSMIIHEKFFDEFGSFIGGMKMSWSYSGTFDSGTGEYIDGKLIYSWNSNNVEMLIQPGYTPKGHYVVWYENKVAVKSVGFGIPWWPIQDLFP